MSRQIALLFPGQGAQYVGMGKDLYETNEAAKAIFDIADAILGYSLTQIMFEGPAETLTETAHCQLAIYVHSAALLAAIGPIEGATFFGGLSLGEYTAMMAAGLLSFEEGLKLVQKRALFMQEAAHSHPGTLAAVIGLDPEALASIVETKESVWIANLNCPGQVVIGGTLEGIDEAIVYLKEAGARRVIPLTVSGAFHTPLMGSAAEKLKPYIDAAPFKEGCQGFTMNTCGDFVTAIEDIQENLFKQVMEPVRFEKQVRALIAKGCDLFIEIGPGRTLSGMMRKIDGDQTIHSVDKAQDIDSIPLESLVGGHA